MTTTIHISGLNDAACILDPSGFGLPLQGLPSDFTAKRKPPPLEVVYNISKKINSMAMPLKAFWLGKNHLLCRWSFTTDLLVKL